MATDVDVQFFSHLNGLTLSNNWGDMIRLLDTCLVNGLPLTSITSATVDAQGDINLTLYAAHNCLLFQIVELSGFAPSGFNGKYRIKGTPTTNTLILKAEKVGQTITTTGTAKLASLGYEIKFRDLNDVKRAYRAIDPTAAHPFIRVDESLSGEGGGTYTSSYAKYAMVGLIENMTSIDDYLDPNKLQLPLDTADFSKNWKIVGTGASVVRGWSRWFWALPHDYFGNNDLTAAPTTGLRGFTLVGNKDSFYFQPSLKVGDTAIKPLFGCGLFDSVNAADITPNWFLCSYVSTRPASSGFDAYSLAGANFMSYSQNTAKLYLTKVDNSNYIKDSILADPIIPNFNTGAVNYATQPDIPALQVPIIDSAAYLRGTMHHICFNAKSLVISATTPMISNNSMFLAEGIGSRAPDGGSVYYYLGELE